MKPVIDESLGRKNATGTGCFFLNIIASQKSEYQSSSAFAKSIDTCFESNSMKEQLQKVEDLVKAEVNVKEIEYLDPDNTFISKKIKPNFVALGKKLGPKMKAVSTALVTIHTGRYCRCWKKRDNII